MLKSFININHLKTELLEMLKNEFESKEYINTDTIDVKLNIKNLINEKIQTLNIEDPIIDITADAFLKISTLVEECTSEVAWHGTVKRNLNHFLIKDILVFPQHVTGTTADGVDGTYEMWIASQPDEIFDELRFHGHSHVNMGVTPSGTDENYYTNLMTHVQDFYITMIINKKHEIELRLYDKINNILYKNLELNICNTDGETYQDWYETNKHLIQHRVSTYSKAEINITKILTQPEVLTQEEIERYEEDAAWDDFLALTETTKKKHMNKKERKALKKEFFKDREEQKLKAKTPGVIKIADPETHTKVFPNIVIAINYIYNQYIETFPLISKKAMFDYMLRNRCLVFDEVLENFNYDLLQTPNGLQIAIMQKELWEVIDDGSK